MRIMMNEEFPNNRKIRTDRRLVRSMRVQLTKNQRNKREGERAWKLIAGLREKLRSSTIWKGTFFLDSFVLHGDDVENRLPEETSRRGGREEQRLICFVLVFGYSFVLFVSWFTGQTNSIYYREQRGRNATPVGMHPAGIFTAIRNVL